MAYRRIVFLLLFFSQLDFNQSKRFLGSATVELKNFSCFTVFTPLVNDFTCIVLKNRPEPVLTIRFSFNEAINSFTLMIILDILKSGSKMNIANVKFEGCKFLSSVKATNFFGRFLKTIQNSSNLPKNCPILANKTYEVTNLTLNGNMYPPGITDMNPIYQFQSKVYRAGQYIGGIESAVSLTY